jgi:hypothetical protein
MSVAREPPVRSRFSSSPRSSVTPLVRKLANQHVIRAVENLVKMADIPATPPPASEEVPSLSTAAIDSSSLDEIKAGLQAVKLGENSAVSLQNRLERRRSNLKVQLANGGVAESGSPAPVSPRKNVTWRNHHDVKIFQRTPEHVEDAGGFRPPTQAESSSEQRVRQNSDGGAESRSETPGQGRWGEGLARVLGAVGGALYQKIALLVGHMPLDEQALGRGLQQIVNRVGDSCHNTLPEDVPKDVYEQLSADVDELAGRFVGLAAAANGSDAAERGELVVAASAVAEVCAEAGVQMRNLLAGMPLAEPELGNRIQSALEALAEIAAENGPSERHAFLSASFQGEAGRIAALFKSLVVAMNRSRESAGTKILAQAAEDLRIMMEGAFVPQVFPLEPFKLDGKMRRMVEHAVEDLREEARLQGLPAAELSALIPELRRRAEALAAGYRAKNVASRQLASAQKS